LQAKGDTTMINILKEYGFQEKKKNNDSGSVKENLDVVDVKTLLEQNKVLAERLNQIEKQMAQLLAERDKGVMPTNQSSVANSAIHYCHEAKPTASLPVQALINAQSATATTSTAVTPTSATTKLESSL
jgi:hypothetical protein